MTSRILTACAIAALTVGTEARAQALPSWSPQTICAADSTPDHCRFLEGQARAQISQQWAFVPSLVRERCLTASGEEETQSWRLFGTCLADAARPPRADAAQTVAAVRPVAGQGADDGSGEVEALRAELITAQADMQELEAAAAQADAEAGNAEEYEARIADLSTRLETAESERMRGEERIANLQERLKTALTARKAASAEFAIKREAMQADLEAARQSADEAGSRADALQTELTEALENAETSTAAEAEAMTARIAELEAALEKADTETQRGNARIEGLQSRLMTLSDAAAADETDENAERISELEAALETAQTESRRSASRIAGLQERLVAAMDATAEPDTAEADAAAARIAELEASLEKSETENKRSTARIAGLQERLVAAMDAAAAEGEPSDTARTDERVAALEAELEKAQSALRTAEVRIEGLQQRLLEAVEEGEAAGDASAEVADLTQQLETAGSRIENLQARLRNSRESVAETAQENALAATNLANARTRIAALQDAMIESRRASEEAATARDAQQQDVAAVEDRFGRLMENQRERAARVAMIVSAQRSRIAELESELDDLRRMAAKAAEQVEDDNGALACQQRMASAVEAEGIQFANNKAEIRADAARTIDRLIVIARDCPDSRITVRGHTDSMGERAYNLYLSELRAAAVVEYMTRNGIAPDRIDAVGVGPDEPVANNNTRVGRAENRRIEIRVQ